MQNSKSVVHFHLVDFGEGYLLLVGKTKSTPCLIDLDCTFELVWSLTIIKIKIIFASGSTVLPFHPVLKVIL